jgi:hypothetical protein
MVIHQGEGMDSNGMLTASFAQETAIVMAIIVVDEYSTAVHATLGDMHRHAGYFETG